MSAHNHWKGSGPARCPECARDLQRAAQQGTPPASETSVIASRHRPPAPDPDAPPTVQTTMGVFQMIMGAPAAPPEADVPVGADAARFQAAVREGPAAWKALCDEAYAAHHRLDLRGANLTGVDLSGANLRGADLRGATFQGAQRIYITHANLRGANLTGVDLTGASLVDSDFSGATMDGANLALTAVGKASFADASLVGATFDEAIGDETSFGGASLSGASFRGATLSFADFRRALCRETRFAGAALLGSNVEGARMARARILPTQVAECNGTPDWAL